jgi:RHS repeat-associated protein
LKAPSAPLASGFARDAGAPELPALRLPEPRTARGALWPALALEPAEQDYPWLYNFRARSYLPGVGLFSQADDWEPEIGSPQTLNPYAYALGNPLNYTDPTGHESEPPTDSTLTPCENGQPADICITVIGDKSDDVKGLQERVRAAENAQFKALLEALGADTLALGGGNFIHLVTDEDGSQRIIAISDPFLQSDNTIEETLIVGGVFKAIGGLLGIIGSTSSRVANIGTKLDFMLGKATGSLHNINRSQSMLRLLQKMGLPDTQATREYLAKQLQRAYSHGVGQLQENGNVLIQSLLAGPAGSWAKMITIWRDNKLVTIMLKSPSKTPR